MRLSSLVAGFPRSRLQLPYISPLCRCGSARSWPASRRGGSLTLTLTLTLAPTLTLTLSLTLTLTLTLTLAPALTLALTLTLTRIRVNKGLEDMLQRNEAERHRAYLAG